MKVSLINTILCYVFFFNCTAAEAYKKNKIVKQKIDHQQFQSVKKDFIHNSRNYYTTFNDSIEKIYICKIIWGKSDCLKRILIDSSGVYQINHYDDINKRSKNKKRINVDVNFYLNMVNKNHLLNTGTVEKTNQNHWTKYTYFVILFMKDKTQRGIFIARVYKYDTLPSTEAERDMYYINQLFDL